ncbi:HTH-type transcriptional regulator DegA [Abditibacteriota bacterium]|nr:HTH-type transcriptional regulator DegA [Abditibacteriota bacterium]
MAITQKQIAQELGVSHQLVSFALNGSGNVAEKTRQEIVTAAERLGYRRNELARAMVTGKSSTLGFLSYEIDESDHMMRVLAGAIDAANEHGYFIRAMHYSKLSDIRKVFERCLEWKVAGLMVMNLMDEGIKCVEREANRFGIPVAFVDNQPFSSADIWVRSDDYNGLRQVIEHLVALGHEKIAFFNGDACSRLSNNRETHFRRLMDLAGLHVEEEWFVYGSWKGDTKKIEAAAQEFLALRPRPTAVVCTGDPFAMVILRAAQKAGLKLPEQLSVTGYANFFLSELANPALTTVDQPFRVMGRTATENLIALTTSDQTLPLDKDDQLLPTRLIVRDSTAPPARADQ